MPEQETGSAVGTPPVEQSTPSPTKVDAIFGKVPDSFVEEEFNPSVETDETKKAKPAEPKEEAPVETPEAEAKEPLIPQEEPSVEAPPSRDYSIFDPADAAAFKHMGNQSFARVSQIYSEWKAQQQDLQRMNDQVKVFQERNPSLDTHPQGFVLNPDYQNKAAELQSKSSEVNYWQNTLAMMKAGNPGKMLVQARDGSYMEGSEIPPTEENIQRVISFIADSTLQARTLQADLKQIEKGHSTFISEAKGQVTSFMDQAFPEFKDPNSQWSKAAAALESKLPAAFRSNILAPLLARYHITLDALRSKVKDSMAKETRKTDQAKAGTPSSKLKQGSPSAKVITAEDFDRLLVDD